MNVNTESNYSKSYDNINKTGNEIINEEENEYCVNVGKCDLNISNSNYISTSKYCWHNVIPKIAIEQFSKMTNIYFLIITILQVINEISISMGKPVILLPFLFIIFVNGFKDFWEDLKRKKQDNNENYSECENYDFVDEKFKKIYWKDIKLGHIIKVYNNSFIPCDLILLKTEEINSCEENKEENSNQNRMHCYVNTMNLDGESNLKIKRVNPDLLSCKEKQYFNESKIITHKPNSNIYKFNAKFRIAESNVDPIILNIDNLLLRGCCLKQTKSILGIAVYVGHNTKIMKNIPNQSQKFSRIEKKLQKLIIIILIVQLIFSILGSVIYIINSIYDKGYLAVIIGESKETYSYFYLFILRTGTWVLIFTNLVPVSMIVTLDMVKYLQAIFINWDYKIYDTEKRVSSNVQTSTLNEELGQIKYIFTDKTGTLTQNSMKFKSMCIMGKIFGLNSNSKFKIKVNEFKNNGEIIGKNDDLNIEFENHVSANSKESSINDNKSCLSEFVSENNIDEKQNYQNEYSEFKDDSFEIILNNIYKCKNLKFENDVLRYSYEFIRCLAICHSVITESIDNNIYQASSPDELALVNASKNFGIEYLYSDVKKIYLKIMNENVTVEKIGILEYSSERKRMSIIVKDEFGRYILYCKGSDDKLFSMSDESSSNSKIIELRNSIKIFSNEGLRTLLIGFKILSDNELIEFMNEYKNANLDLENKELLIEKSFEKIENGLFVLGVSAVEDKLQNEVPETLRSLQNAGIRIWILTGDKPELAKQIGYSSGLLNNTMKIFDLCNYEEKNIDEIKSKLYMMERIIIGSQKNCSENENQETKNTEIDDNKSLNENFIEGDYGRTSSFKQFINRIDNDEDLIRDSIVRRYSIILSNKVLNMIFSDEELKNLVSLH